MIRSIRKRKKVISIFILSCLLCQVLTPSVSWALTTGPTQPEVHSFQQASTTDMVDLFTGDFSYNIPLFELPGPNGGYPFNLSYESGISMDQEASWVGLGWSLNPGAINRQMRGLPDEFKGDLITTKMTMKPNVTVGVGGGVAIELFGKDLKVGDKGTKSTAHVGFSINQNSYNGFGYSIDVDAGLKNTAGNGKTKGVGLSLSLDSKEGLNASPSLSLGDRKLSAEYNSKQGLASVSLEYFKRMARTDPARMMRSTKNDRALGGSAVLSLAHTGYTPQISMPMVSDNLSLTLKFGASWWGVFGHPYVKGFYNDQRLKHDNRSVSAPAYGYLNHQFVTDKSALMDFNREKDGVVTKESPNLSIPLMTYDIYSVSGQGISAMYRPMRNDFGVLRDPEVESTTLSGSAGVDLAGAFAHLGANLEVNHVRSVSGAWTKNDLLSPNATFSAAEDNKLFEPWYFKVHGEPAVEKLSDYNAIGGDKAARVQLSDSRVDTEANPYLELKGRPTTNVPSPNKDSRKPRNQIIQAITNEQLLNASNGSELLSYFQIQYLEGGVINNLNRADGFYPLHHIAGFTALTPEGMRYNYAIPAYNLEQQDFTFSVVDASANTGKVGFDVNGSEIKLPEDTDKFLKQTTLPKYAHSHLLTSIIGPDYVDVDKNGISDNDLGYWVKFTYERKASALNNNAYQWRDPFVDAHHDKGYETDLADDKASFSYGKKELWYLAIAETKSHVAYFEISPRNDARGVKDIFQKEKDADGNPMTGAQSYKLNSIKLYSKLAPTTPIKTVVFNYFADDPNETNEYELCENVPNADNNQRGVKGGKLTLKSLHFEYGTSGRGQFNPYQFFYHHEGAASDENPKYDPNAYDRWGNYKPYPDNNPGYNKDCPYVDQTSTTENKAKLDKQAAVWSLKEITLPSGGHIVVDYETDDYGYVQHMQAMQMTSVVNYSDPLSNKIDLSSDNMVMFRLEKPVPATLSEFEKQNEVRKYLDLKRGKLLFKYKISLRKESEETFEYVTGYVEIDQTDPNNMGLRKLHDADSYYTFGYFRVTSADGFNPFSMRAWQHLRTNQPMLTSSDKKLDPIDPDKPSKRIDQIKSLGSLGDQLKKMFKGFYKYCKDEHWGTIAKPEVSWIRLNSPDKIKYGGGLRVKQITMQDNWGDGEGSVYGQYYDYTTTEGNATISSGVAAYEPIVGGEENALRFAKEYIESIPLMSDNNLYFEYPINESCYPAPQVGYRKVTVLSLAAANRLPVTQRPALAHVDGKFPINTEYGTTGKTVHEFYTAKDFPIIADETEKLNKQFKMILPIAFLGTVSISKLTASQGYSIVTNDMHGKPKKVSNYRQDAQGNIEPEAISWVQYNYLQEPKTYQMESVAVLKNTFEDQGDGILGISTSSSEDNVYTLGQETEMFHDMRDHEDVSWGGGANYNTDFVVVPLVIPFTLPIGTIWPNVNSSRVKLQTVVTNKIIFKSGILSSTEAFDGGSLVNTENLKWDKKTGGILLTRVNNDFNNPIYSYNIPAHSQYQGMGSAYQNIGLTFNISEVKKKEFSETMYSFKAAQLNEGTLFPGDEILLYEADAQKPFCKVIYSGKESPDDLLYSPASLTDSDYRGMIIRSGFRNQLSVSAGSITALEDPTLKGTVTVTTKTIKVPK